MEPTLEGWRQAKEIVSRWVWIHLKVREPEGVDISSMSELVCEKPYMPPEAHGGPIFSLLTSEEGRGASCGLGRSPAGCDLLAVACLGKAEEKGRMALSPRASSGFDYGRNLRD